jgi:hypothetical protein
MRFDYGDKATSITALGAIIRQAILENKKINEMAIEDTAQEPLIFRDIDEHYGVARLKAESDRDNRKFPVCIFIKSPRYISEREQPYDMYDVIIQVFIMDGLEFDKHGEMIYENTQMDRLTAYILEVLASLNHRWLCDFDCLALKIEDSPIGESTLVGAEIALLLKGKVRTI